MPFQSEKQRRYLWMKHPEIAKKWAREFPGQKNLPKYKHKSFKEWMILSEALHFQLPKGVEIDGKEIHFIDMKFEMYTDKFPTSLWHSNWYGKIPNKEQYLVHKNGKLEVHSHMPPNSVQLPDDWWEYAMAEFSDGEIKRSNLSVA